MVLTGAHYIYIIFMIIILITMIMKKESVVPCVIGIFCLGLFYTNSCVGALNGVFNSFVVALNELGGIILIIGIMVALSKALEDNNAIDFMVKPFAKVIKNATSTFFVAGIAMFFMSWFFWPSPACALIGAIFLPIAKRCKLPAVGLAVAINLFGHGLALSTDFIIQGAPSITAGAAGISVQSVMVEGMPLYWVMGIVTIAVAFYMLRKDMKKGMFDEELALTEEVNFESKDIGIKAKISVLVVVIAFILDILGMYYFDLKGGDATALLGGTSVVLLIFVNLLSKPKTCLDNVAKHIIHGFGFAISIFAVIIPIAAFFYLGDAHLTTVFGDVLSKGSQGLLGDLGLALSNAVPFNNVAAAGVETVVGAITGLDGSGFSGMSLAGSLALVFGNAIQANIAVLTALGQIAAIWVGGGCLVPWSLIAAAAICGVNPIELAKRNFIPVMTGLVVTTIVAMFLI
ncbi:MAG: hypothetical protein RSG52_02010 [Terrisporobacter sp.]|uniref:hypothetical protein n=1 Tax=Terrisporobacter sp. TaxID=1965305 RepID=UPI002FCC80F6